MSATPSTMLALGTRLPDFRLKNAVDDRWIQSSELKSPRGVLAMFICNHCPYVIHVRPELLKAAHALMDQQFDVVAINSNNEKTHPQDGPSAMRRLAQEEGWRFPFLYDEDQRVARQFQAACTPDFYLFDAQRKLVYRGQFDDSRPGNKLPVSGKDLRAATEALLKGETLATQKPSIGCNIKWLPGNEPDYFR